jgi:hypothetical protein
VETLQLICNSIVLISAVFIAIKNIGEMIGKPIKLFRKKSDDELDKKVRAIVQQMMPDILYNHDLETKKTYLADRERYLQDITNTVIERLGGKLDKVDGLARMYQSLEISAKDVLREKIVALYENNKEGRKLKHFEKRALDQYYKDYKAMNGNSYIDIIYERMKTWEVEPDDYE